MGRTGGKTTWYKQADRPYGLKSKQGKCLLRNDRISATKMGHWGALFYLTHFVFDSAQSKYGMTAQICKLTSNYFIHILQ